MLADSNPAGTWMHISYECCVLSGRGPCDVPITRTEDFFTEFGVSECDRETSTRRRPSSTRFRGLDPLGLASHKKNRRYVAYNVKVIVNNEIGRI
jgi:hypothetical protein